MPDPASVHMPNITKAAIAVVSMGSRRAVDIVARAGLGEQAIEHLAQEIARLGEIDTTQRDAVLKELSEPATEDTAGGVRFAESFLTSTLGPVKAADIVRRIKPRQTEMLFAAAIQADTPRLLTALQDERPQTIAIVLRHLPKVKAGEILSRLPDDQRTAVVMRLLNPRLPSFDVLTRVDRALQQKLAVNGSESIQAQAPTQEKHLVDILNHTDISVERAVLDALADQSPELAERVRNAMFVFEDLPTLDARTLQMVLRELDTSDLAFALKNASEEIKTAVFENLSSNAVASLKEDLDALGRVRRGDVLARQQKIVMAIREMIHEGKIELNRGQQSEEQDEDETLE